MNIEKEWIMLKKYLFFLILCRGIQPNGRRNLVDIPNYCSDTWEKIDIKRIKENLNIYLKKNDIIMVTEHNIPCKVLQEWYDLYIETDGKPWINLYYYWENNSQ
jgi:hypothetical protein